MKGEPESTDVAALIAQATHRSWFRRWIMDPLFWGLAPGEMRKARAQRVKFVREMREMKAIQRQILTGMEPQGELFWDAVEG